MSVHGDQARYFTASDGARIAFWLDDFTPPWKPGPVLLLMHSAMGNSQRFFGWMPHLLGHMRVLRFDLRGHGLSHLPKPEEEFSLERLVDDAVELLDHLGIKQAHICGNSAGGYVAQRLAITQPARCLSLATYGSTPGLTPAVHAWFPRIAAEGLTGFLAATIEQRFDVKSSDPGLVQWFLEQTAENDPAFIERFVRHMSSRAWGPELTRVQCPTLVVYPGEETVGGTDGYEPYRSIPGVEMKAYEHMPHNVADMVPKRCAEDLVEFLQRRCGL